MIARDEHFGELSFGLVLLPQDAPAGEPGQTPEAAVANELSAALRWAANSHANEFAGLRESFASLSPAVTTPAYKKFAAETSSQLRTIGWAGLIAANEPDGVRLASAGWNEIQHPADLYPVIASLMGYSNPTDRDAVVALGVLALHDSAEPQLRDNASYALRCIHTKDALPALVALLDQKQSRTIENALAGLCLFVRNAPTVTSASIPSMSWMQIQQPAAYLTPETEPYCHLGGAIDSAKAAAYINFWKSWWTAHGPEIQGR